MSEYERILEFAEKRLQEKSTRGDVLTIRYWVGVIDGIKGLKRLCEKDIPKTVTHEATLYRYRTCPNCKNVVDEKMTWGNSQILVIPQYCKFCGQKMKTEEE